MENEKKYYSICCGSYMYYWPDTDICPRCGEHSCALDENERLEDERDRKEWLKKIEMKKNA
ncbi:MAG: hypothetical protein PHP92_04075 [Candidatus Nanoarchaeia archaeon]|nr:hypothetical protein [Candidatus Nanoarchaeia archaeon]